MFKNVSLQKYLLNGCNFMLITKYTNDKTETHCYTGSAILHHRPPTEPR